jgi:hypothetical protein
MVTDQRLEEQYLQVGDIHTRYWAVGSCPTSNTLRSSIKW